MYYSARRKKKPQSAISLCSFSVPILLLLSVSSDMQSLLTIPAEPAPVARVTVQEQTVVYNSLPVARNIPAKPELVIVEPVVVKPVAVKPVNKVPAKVAVKQATARLIIPKIGVNAVIRDMGVTVDGAMAVPANRVEVGWYRDGTRPGEAGSAVVGGHNRWDDAVAVFIRLDELNAGDVLSVVDAKGVTSSFVVREMRTYEAADPDSGIFDSVSGIHLNLITCSGEWNPLTDSYTTRLVVFTDLVV